MKLFRHLLAVIVLAMPAIAFGAITAPPSTNSDVFLVVTNPTTFATEVIDLGVSASSLANLPSQSFTVDSALIANLGGNASALNFQVVATQGTAGATAGTVLYTTVFPGSGSATSGTVLGTQLTTLGNWFAANGAAFATAGSYQTFLTTSANASWVQNAGAIGAPGSTYGLAGVVTSATVGTALSMYSYTSTGRSTAPTTSSVLGTWTLSGNVLSFVSAATPLPAAAWLFMSGLLGFGGVTRRRRLAA